ncbi:MAG: hypothetical protein FWF15_05695 [Oscillospiraceae bacterium]|nr:hypothetical protein [Oscillospiraceae bacterium]
MNDTGKTPHEMIQILPVEKYQEALYFIELGRKMNCKSQVRYAASNKYWRCVFSNKKPQRVLYTVECTDEWWRIKACLWNIDNYRDVLSSCSDRIKNDILSAYSCKSCNSHCKCGAGFTFDNIRYQKCVGVCFYFSNLCKDDFDNLALLITKEYEAINV